MEKIIPFEVENLKFIPSDKNPKYLQLDKNSESIMNVEVTGGIKREFIPVGVNPEFVRGKEVTEETGIILLKKLEEIAATGYEDTKLGYRIKTLTKEGSAVGIATIFFKTPLGREMYPDSSIVDCTLHEKQYGGMKVRFYATGEGSGIRGFQTTEAAAQEVLKVISECEV